MAIQLTEKQIQEGWQVVKFGDIAKNISERVEPAKTDLDVYVGLEHLDPQSLRITRRGVPSDVKGQKLRVRPGQIIFGKRRAYQKKVAVADFDGICSAHAMVLEAIPGKILPELLPFFMQSDVFMDRAIAISEGSLSPTIKWKTLANQQFLFSPAARQKEILIVLQKLDVTDCTGAAFKESAKLLFKAVSISLLRIVSQQSTTLDTKIQKGWHVKSLSQIAQVERGKFTPRPRNNPIYYGGRYPFVQTADVKNSGGFIKSHNQTLNEKGLGVSRIFPKGSILLTIAANIGEVGLTTYETACTDSVVAIQPNEDIDPQWLLFYLMQLQPYLDSVATESAQKNINLKILRPLKIAVPPYAEQIKISETLLNLFQVNTSSKDVELNTLRSQLMMRFFGGIE